MTSSPSISKSTPVTIGVVFAAIAGAMSVGAVLVLAVNGGRMLEKLVATAEGSASAVASIDARLKAIEKNLQGPNSLFMSRADMIRWSTSMKQLNQNTNIQFPDTF